MQRRPQVLIFDGATGSGKSTCLEHVREAWSTLVEVGCKLTTRNRRPMDNDWEFQFVKEIPVSPKFVIFGAVGSEYAIEMSQITKSGRNGRIWATVCTDAQAIASLKSEFDLRVVYVHRCDLESKIGSILSVRGKLSGNERRQREIEVDTALDKYTEQIDAYDHVIINGREIEMLRKQVDRIVQSLARRR